MGALTFANFKSYLKFRMGNNEDLSTPTDYYAIWVNMAYSWLTTQDILLPTKQELYFPELETSTSKSTSDGVTYVTVPSDCLAIREIYDTTNNVRLNWIPFSEYVARTDRADTSSEGDPIYWTRSGGNIYIYPTPDATYSLTIYYKKIVTDLDGATYNVTVIGKEWDSVILELAVYFARKWMNEPEKERAAFNDAMQMIAGLMDVYSTEQRARRENVRPDLEWMSSQKNTY